MSTTNTYHWLTNLFEKQKPEPVEKPMRSFDLIIHTGWHQIDPSWSLVLEKLKETNSVYYWKDGKFYGKFCILAYANKPEDYIQTLYDRDQSKRAWRLERRVWYPDGSWSHYYGRINTDQVGSDTIKIFDCVIEAFRCFYCGKPYPEYLTWVPWEPQACD